MSKTIAKEQIALMRELVFDLLRERNGAYPSEFEEYVVSELKKIYESHHEHPQQAFSTWVLACCNSGTLKYTTDLGILLPDHDKAVEGMREYVVDFEVRHFGQVTVIAKSAAEAEKRAQEFSPLRLKPSYQGDDLVIESVRPAGENDE